MSFNTFIRLEEEGNGAQIHFDRDVTADTAPIRTELREVLVPSGGITGEMSFGTDYHSDEWVLMVTGVFIRDALTMTWYQGSSVGTIDYTIPAINTNGYWQVVLHFSEFPPDVNITNPTQYYIRIHWTAINKSLGSFKVL